VRQVTRKDVRDAALLGQIIAEADLSMSGTICITEEGGCGHLTGEHCVADAIGATERAVGLWMRVSWAITNSLDERAEEIADAETAAERRWIARFYAWVDAVCGPIDDDLGKAELHAAALLAEGQLPPGWRVR
jgi:hypothetical protein